MNRSIRWVIIGLVALFAVIAIVLFKTERPLAGNSTANSLADKTESKGISEHGKVSFSSKSDNENGNAQPMKSNRENNVRKLSEEEHQYLTKRR